MMESRDMQPSVGGLTWNGVRPDGTTERMSAAALVHVDGIKESRNKKTHGGETWCSRLWHS
jgi:hypothetical protein